ncbi:MAG: HAD-IB family hydrolase [Myxococcota bacterium]
MNGRRLALFDFDGTITTRDTMFLFVWHARGGVRTVIGLTWLLPMLIAHRIGLVPADRAKEILLRHFLGGFDRAALDGWARSFVARVEGVIRPEARKRLDWHRAQGHDVWIVSASLDLWVAPWVARYGGVNLACTTGRFEGDRFTGRLGSPNCNGAEKEVRVRAAVDLDRYEHVYGYGDSSGDAELLALADEVWFRPFRADSPSVRTAPASPNAGSSAGPSTSAVEPD